MTNTENISRAQDFVINGVVAASPDSSRQGEVVTERKERTMFDVHNTLRAADGVGELFTGDAEFSLAIAEHCNCGEVDRFVALLQALDHYDTAAFFLGQHIEADDCRIEHPDAEAVERAAAETVN